MGSSSQTLWSRGEARATVGATARVRSLEKLDALDAGVAGGAQGEQAGQLGDPGLAVVDDEELTGAAAPALVMVAAENLIP